MVVQLARPSDEEQLKNLQAARFQPNPGPMLSLIHISEPTRPY